MKLKQILEMMEKERVIRKGKWKIRYTSSREGYRVLNNDGQRKEVRMSPSEIRKRRLSGKKAARRMKGKRAQINARRKRSMAKRGK